MANAFAHRERAICRPSRAASRTAMEQIVSGTYPLELSPDEQALLGKVPEQSKPWFMTVVVNEFYLPLRGVVRAKQAGPSAASAGTRFLETLVVQLTSSRNGDTGTGKWKLTLKEDYDAHNQMFSVLSRSANRRPDVNFEAYMEKKMKAYRDNVINNIRVCLHAEAFPYIPPYEVIRALRRH